MQLKCNSYGYTEAYHIRKYKVNKKTNPLIKSQQYYQQPTQGVWDYLCFIQEFYLIFIIVMLYSGHLKGG